MTIKELKELLANASDNDRLELVDGEITLVKEKPIEYKFKVGDRVTSDVDPDTVYTIIKQFAEDGKPMYVLKFEHGYSIECEEDALKFYVSQDITEWIKTFYGCRRVVRA